MEEFICPCHKSKFKTKRSLNVHLWRVANPDKVKKWEQENPRKEERKTYRLKNQEKKKIYDTKYFSRENRKKYSYPSKWDPEENKSNRNIIIDHYGGKCACCGESIREFLVIDHIGGIEKSKRKRGNRFYKEIIKSNFPTNLRILCHNCNMALGIYGYCPHNPKEMTQEFNCINKRKI